MKILELLTEISLGNYTKKATMDRAMSKMSAAFGKPEDKEKHLRKADVRDKGLARAKIRHDKARAAADEKARADALERDRANRGNLEAELASLQKQFDPNFEYSDDYSFWSKQKGIQSQIHGLKNRLARLDEDPSVGTTNTGNIPAVPNPHLSPGKGRGNTSYTGTPGKSGTKAPPQPKPKMQKPTDNALDKNVSLFGAGAVKRR